MKLKKKMKIFGTVPPKSYLRMNKIYTANIS